MSENPTNVKVQIDRSLEVEALRKEKEAAEALVEEKEGIIAQQALNEFEKHKEKLAVQFHDENIKDCSSPQELYSYIASKSEEKQPEKHRDPTGKAMISLPSNDGENYESYNSMVDELYRRAYYDPTLPREEQKAALDRINSLWHSYETGKSAALLRESQSNREKIMKPLSECPVCHRTQAPLTKSNPVCEYCGLDVREKNENRRGTSLPPRYPTKNAEVPTFR